MVLNRGDSGPEVEQLQIKLKAAGYDPGDVDGSYGARTEAAVLALQLDYPDVDDDGVAGPQTMHALHAAISRIRPVATQPQPASEIVPCDDATWAEFMGLVASVTARPVRYGPGRGLFVDGHWLITYGAGRQNGTVKQWPNVLGKTYPAFHCTSWCNFFMSWLCKRDEKFTHAGNRPDVWEVMLNSPELHKDDEGAVYRGFGDVAYVVPPDGSAAKRHGVAKIMDARELFDRRHDLPTFMVFGQSTKKPGGWKWWHHTGVYAVRDGKLYRIAADGSKGASGYSAKPMRFVEITEKNLGDFANVIYRVYGVRTSDGTYGDPAKPYAPVAFEP